MAEHNVTLELFWSGTWHLVPALIKGGCEPMRGVSEATSATDPARVVLLLPNDDGLWAPRSFASPLRGLIGQNTPARVTIDTSQRLTGEVSQWTVRRAVKSDRVTEIVVSGILQRIGRGTDPIQSAITRASLQQGPVAYWSLEGLVGSLSVDTSLLTTTNTVTWGDSTLTPGLRSMPRTKTIGDPLVVPAQPALLGTINGTNAAAWSVSIWVIGTPADALDLSGWSIQLGPGPVQAPDGRPWTISMRNGPSWAGAYSTVGFGAGSAGASSGTAVFDSAYHHVCAVVEQTVAGTIRSTLYVDGVAVVGTPGSTWTLQALKYAEIGWNQGAASGTPPSHWMGGVAVYDRALTLAQVQSITAAGNAYLAESAAARFARVCVEEGITSTVVHGASSTSVAMGPQTPVPLLDLLDELCRTDDALIFETRSSLGLTMRTGESRQNQAPDLTLNYLGQIEPTLEPVSGDKGLVNDCTATAPDGTTARAEQVTGPRNTATPNPATGAVGRYKSGLDVNPWPRSALADAAGWRVLRGTYDGTWYAEVTVDLDAAPGLVTAVNAIDIGDLVAIANLPVEESLSTVEGIVIGIKETNPAKRRKVTFFLVPAEPYQVGILSITSGETDVFSGHLESDGAVTSGATAAGAATFAVASSPLWTVDADDFPMDVLVGGQRVSISSVSGGASPQTFTVAVTGAYKLGYAVASGQPVAVFQPLTLTQ